jgi:hypothetical protein
VSHTLRCKRSRPERKILFITDAVDRLLPGCKPPLSARCARYATTETLGASSGSHDTRRASVPARVSHDPSPARSARGETLALRSPRCHGPAPGACRRRSRLMASSVSAGRCPRRLHRPLMATPPTLSSASSRCDPRGVPRGAGLGDAGEERTGACRRNSALFPARAWAVRGHGVRRGTRRHGGGERTPRPRTFPQRGHAGARRCARTHAPGGGCTPALGARSAGRARHHGWPRRSCGGLGCPVGVAAGRAARLGPLGPRSHRPGGGGRPAPGADGRRARAPRCLEGAVAPQHGPRLCAPRVAHHPCASDAGLGETRCTGPSAGGGSGPCAAHPGGVPALTATAGMGRDRAPCCGDADASPRPLRPTSAGPAARGARCGASHQHEGRPGEDVSRSGLLARAVCPWHVRGSREPGRRVGVAVERRPIVPGDGAPVPRARLSS